LRYSLSQRFVLDGPLSHSGWAVQSKLSGRPTKRTSVLQTPPRQSFPSNDVAALAGTFTLTVVTMATAAAAECRVHHESSMRVSVIFAH
jgi:hypothetical protein